MLTQVALPVNSGATHDIVVLGGGVSGSIAAIAAARLGADVLLVEEHGFLGGSLTAMGVGPMMSFHNPAGEQVVRGIPDELIQRLVAKGGSLGHIADSTTYCSTVTPFDSEALKIELEAMLREAGGTVLYHTQLAAVRGDGERIDEVVLCNKVGLSAVRAKVFVDASGDGDLAARAGAPFQRGREGDGAMQPMTMNLKLANVDSAAIRRFAAEHPEEFGWTAGRTEGLARLAESPRVSLGGYRSAWRAAIARGEVDVPRDVVLFFETSEPGVVIVNTSRVIGLDSTDPYQLSRAESIGRQQCVQILAFLRRHAVGFEKAIRMDTAAKIGVRESRHIVGRHLLTAEDLLGLRSFPDVIALGAYPIDIHAPTNERTISTHLGHNDVYQIPLRSLLPEKIENLVVVGRCISATHEAAAAIRVTPIAMAIGQAGGVVAGEACRRGLAPGAVNHEIVQATLRAQGAKLPAKLASPSGRNLRRHILPLLALPLTVLGEPGEPSPLRSFSDIPYAGTSNPRQALDVYLPAAPASEQPLPVIVFIHGGGWSSGSRADGAGVLRSAVASGHYAGVSVGYRFTDEATWPAQGEDVKAAIRWIRGNAEKFHLDRDKIGVWGGSAGGQLASFLGASGGVREVEGELGEHLGQSSRVTCVVNFYGPQNFLSTRGGTIASAPVRGLLGGDPAQVPNVARAASPVTYLTGNAPPFFTVHGTDDKTVPFGQALELDDALKKVGATHYFVAWTGGGHRSRSSETRRRVQQFFDLYLRGVPAAIDTSPVVPDPEPEAGPR